MTSFSKQPSTVVEETRSKGYVGLAFEQGVPVLDRDLNLLGALAVADVGEVLSALIGLGDAEGGFAVIGEDRNDFSLSAGVLTLPGRVIENPSKIRYSEQDPPPPPLTPFPVTDDERATRRDIVYVDAWDEEVTSDVDPDLASPHDVGLETSARRRARWRVRVAEAAEMPLAEAGHIISPLAVIVRPGDGRGNKIDAWMIEDKRVEGLSLSEASRKLARVERALAPAIDSARGFNDLDHYLTTNELLIKGDRFDLGDSPSISLGGRTLTTEAVLVAPSEAYWSTPLQDRYSVKARLPASIPHGRQELSVFNGGGEARRNVNVLERWRVTSASVQVNYYYLPFYRGWGMDVASGPSALDVWVAGDVLFYSYGYPLQRWLGGAQWRDPIGFAMRVAVDPQGSLWTVNNNGDACFAQRDPTGQYYWWYYFFPGAFIDVGVGAEGSVWRLDAQSISKFDGTDWSAPVSVPGGGYRVAVDGAGAPWVVTATKEIRRYNGQTWEAPLPGEEAGTVMKANDVAVGEDGVLWVIGELDSSGNGRVYSRRGAVWQRSDCWGVSIAAGFEGRPWVVDAANVVRRRDLEVFT